VIRCKPHPRRPSPSVAGVEGDWLFAVRAPRLDASEALARRTSGRAPEAELERLLRAEAPTRRVLCALAARALEIRSWSRLGFARASDQTRERQGISSRSLQELARVHRVLNEAPRVDAAFQTGQIGWTAVRALARLGSIGDEALWLGRAKALPLPELERAVRRARAEREAPPPSPEEGEEWPDRVPIACTRPVRAKWRLGRELARRVTGGRLPSWECAEVVAAELSSAAPLARGGISDLDEELQPGTSLGEALERSRPACRTSSDLQCEGPDGEGRGATGSASEAPPRCRVPPPVSAELAPLLEGLSDVDAFEIDRRLRRGVRLERTWEARIGPLLRRVLEGRRYRWRGYWDRDLYLEERLGMCRRKARALVRIERLLERAPAVARAYRSGRLSWVQIQGLAPLLEAGIDRSQVQAWVRRAGQVTVRRLEDDVRGALARADLGPAAAAELDEVPEEAIGVKDRQIGARRRMETATLSFHAPPESARFFRAVLEAVRERLAAVRGAPVTEGEALEAMLDHAIQVWSRADERARREYRIFERDGWRCAVPGCTSYRNLQLHHIVFRSQGGGDEPENLITLCAWHHQRGVHGGLVRITGRAPDRLRFELGLREGEPPLVVYDSEERLIR